MNGFTPIEQLPMPPKFMLDELEEEIKKYNTFLLSQIFTIREATPIRNAIRQKLQVHPVVKMIRSFARSEFDMSFPQLIEYKKSSMWVLHKDFNIDSRINLLPEEIKEKLKFKSGKRKGQFNPKLKLLAEEIIIHFYAILNSRCNWTEENWKLGFWKYFDNNFLRNKSRSQKMWSFD
jgi:hypothetical protein